MSLHNKNTKTGTQAQAKSSQNRKNRNKGSIVVDFIRGMRKNHADVSHLSSEALTALYERIEVALDSGVTGANSKPLLSELKQLTKVPIPTLRKVFEERLLLRQETTPLPEKQTRSKYLTEEQYDIFATECTLYYGDGKMQKSRTALVLILMDKLGKSRATIQGYLKLCIVENEGQNGKKWVFSAYALRERTRIAKASNGTATKYEAAKEFCNIIIAMIMLDKNMGIETSPEQAIQLYRRNLAHTARYKHVVTVSLSTFYSYIDCGLFKSCDISLINLDLQEKLSRKHSTEPKRVSKTSTKGTPIHERPFDLTDRSKYGHWEGDLIVGKSAGQHKCLFTLVERKSGYCIVRIISGKTQQAVWRELNKIEREYGAEQFALIFKSITFDNGSEFSKSERFEASVFSKKKRTKIYYADSYASYQRGINERCNREVRRYVKKGEVFDHYTAKDIYRIQHIINNKLTKRHDWKSNKEIFQVELETLQASMAS